MIPVGAIGGLVAAARRGRGLRSNEGLGRGFALRLVAFIAVLGVLPVVLHLESWGLGALLVPLLMVLLPSLPTALLVRAGAVRQTLWLWRVAGYPLRPPETPPYPAFQAARALLRSPGIQGERRIVEHLQGCVELGVSGAAASGLLALVRGDREAARGIFAAIEGQPRREVPTAFARLACDVRVLDAAARGDWVRLGLAPPEELGSRRARFFAALGAQVAPATGARPSPVRLLVAWAFAPDRRLTRPLVGAASADAPSPAPASERPGEALEAHVAALARPPGHLRPVDLEAAVRSIDALRGSPRALADLQRRALSLPAGSLPVSGESVLSQVADEAESDLTSLMLEARLPAAWLPAGEVGERLRQRVQEERLSRVESLATDLGRRASAGNDLAEAEEWRAFGALRLATAETLEGALTSEDREAVFGAVYRPLTSFAVRLCNVRSRRTLARLMFLFLRDFAATAGTASNREFTTRNVEACRAEFLGRAPAEGDLRCDLARVTRRRRWLEGLGVLGWMGWVGGAALEHRVWFWWALMLALMVLGGPLAVITGRLLRGLVEVVEADEGYVLQGSRLRFLALRSDIRAVSVRGTRVHLELARRPRWLPRTPYTLAASAEGAHAIASAITSAIGGATLGGHEGSASHPP